MKNFEPTFVSDNDADFVKNIVDMNTKFSVFWASAHGWAPDDAATLLSKSRLDWQVSLSETLHFWVEKDTMSDGELILAWANLGALLEGTLKLFFSIYYSKFQSDIEALKKAGAYDHRRNTHKLPDRLTLETFRVYACQNDVFRKCDRILIKLIQSRRNAIHAFRDRELGTVDEFRQAARSYSSFLTDVDLSVPYPDDT